MKSMTTGFARNYRSERKALFARLLNVWCFSSAVLVCCGGCGAPAPPAPTAPVQAAPQTYFAPLIYGEATGRTSPPQSIFTFDDTAKTFYQSTDVFNDTQTGAQTFYAGGFSALDRGLLSLGITYSYNPATQTGITYSPPLTGSWALEMPDQSGGLVQLVNQPPVPAVAAKTCPSSAKAQRYAFITLPAPLNTSTQQAILTWNPSLETAYGTVDISGDGQTTNLANIQQLTLAPGGTPGSPQTPGPSSVTGACSSTFYGNTTIIPGQIVITDPGKAQMVSPPAVLGIGPSGLLVESNGNGQTFNPPYSNVLGAGTGAIGMPEPSSPVDAGSVVAAQYMGFFYGSTNSNVQNAVPTSLLASFGFATQPSTCANVVPKTQVQTNTMIYGGDFANNDPTSAQSSGGYGRCDVAIDLGPQDPSNNGLFPSATVYLGSGSTFAGNGFGPSYSFPAVAIAGQLDGKYVIFLLGVDTTGSPQQAWGIYLLQSN